ncbi:hypothetical protein WMY93_010100 [Mugilogobius chulae]|uniref:Secreted protein n=1 Tax=Mugilogobius chulae TaxID=88201 RepID=A0AAW0P9S2_9GOBI
MNSCCLALQLFPRFGLAVSPSRRVLSLAENGCSLCHSEAQPKLISTLPVLTQESSRFGLYFPTQKRRNRARANSPHFTMTRWVPTKREKYGVVVVVVVVVV